MKNIKKYNTLILILLIYIGSCKTERIKIENCDCETIDLIVGKRQFQLIDSLVIKDLKAKFIDLKSINEERVIFGDTILFNCSNDQTLLVLINEDYIEIEDVKYEPQKSIEKLLSNLNAENYVQEKISKALLRKDSIKKLVLRHCNLFSIPEEVFELQNLEYLDLSLNLIEEIPDEISSLKKLKELSISYNLLKRVNPKISELKSIESIWFLDNRLKNIPKEICQLKNLTDLNLTLNPLEELPDCIPEMESLKNIALGREKKHQEKVITQIEEFKIKNKELNIFN